MYILVSLLYVTALHVCHHYGVHSIANVNKKIENKRAGKWQIQKTGE